MTKLYEAPAEDGNVAIDESKPLRNFLVTDRVPCWVTWTYIVQAVDEADAVALYCEGEYDDYGEPIIGESIGFLDNEIEAQDEEHLDTN